MHQAENAICAPALMSSGRCGLTLVMQTSHKEKMRIRKRYFHFVLGDDGSLFSTSLSRPSSRSRRSKGHDDGTYKKNMGMLLKFIHNFHALSRPPPQTSEPFPR